jgi:predicted DNA-binding transcriptional regulator AlpA
VTEPAHIPLSEFERLASVANDNDAAMQQDIAEQRRDGGIEERFARKSASQLVAMWRTGRTAEGKVLSDDEGVSLLAAWGAMFDGHYPPPDSFGCAADDAPALLPLGRGSEVAGPTRAIDTSLIPDGLLSREQLADIMNCSKATVARMVRDGRLPVPLKVSARRIMFRGDEVRWTWELKAKADQDAKTARRDALLKVKR